MSNSELEREILDVVKTNNGVGGVGHLKPETLSAALKHFVAQQRGVAQFNPRKRRRRRTRLRQHVGGEQRLRRLRRRRYKSKPRTRRRRRRRQRSKR